MPSSDFPLDTKPTRTQTKLTLVLELIDQVMESHSFSQLSELLKRRSLRTTLSIKNIFQSMETNFSTRDPEAFFLVSITQMSIPEELQLAKPFQELVLLRSLQISF